MAGRAREGLSTGTGGGGVREAAREGGRGCRGAHAAASQPPPADGSREQEDAGLGAVRTCGLLAVQLCRRLPVGGERDMCLLSTGVWNSRGERSRNKVKALATMRRLRPPVLRAIYQTGTPPTSPGCGVGKWPPQSCYVHDKFSTKLLARHQSAAGVKTYSGMKYPAHFAGRARDSRRRPRAARWGTIAISQGPGHWRRSQGARAEARVPSDRKILHLPLPRFCMKSRVQHTPSSPCLHFSHQAFWAPAGEFIQGTPLHRPLAEAPCRVSRFSPHPVSAQNRAPMEERAALLGLPSCPRGLE